MLSQIIICVFCLVFIPALSHCAYITAASPQNGRRAAAGKMNDRNKSAEARLVGGCCAAVPMLRLSALPLKRSCDIILASIQSGV